MLRALGQAVSGYYWGGWNASLYEGLNGLAGHSRLFDTLMTLPLDNNLFKAGVIAGCFLFAWYRGAGDAERVSERSTLLLTLLAAFLSLATTQILSAHIFLPRPLVLSQKSFAPADGRHLPAKPLPFHQPLAGESVKSQVRNLNAGTVEENDLHAFPSDHAGFYLTIAVGTALVCWWAGLLAIGWVVVFVIGSKIFAGQHTPLDVLAGGAIGLAFLAILRLVARRTTAPFESASRWTVRHPALSAVLLFYVLFEVTDKMDDVRQLLGVARDLAFHSA
ncbi:MAG: phosphatase PAP2 family protein [Allosphingosinicella sp.]